MKQIPTILLFFGFFGKMCFSQILPPKQAYPLTVKQIHSGHSLTDPLFYPYWPGQFVNLMANVTGQAGWQLMNSMVGKSTAPGSAMKARWEKPVGPPDARNDIKNWELMCITERVPLLYPGGSSQQWYIDGIAEQRNYLSLFVNNAWSNGNGGKGSPTLLWTTWTRIDNADGPFRAMLDVYEKEWEAMQDFANSKRPADAPPVYIIPGHRMMAKLFDDIQAGLVPGISSISQFFSDNIHTNELGAYAISMIHYACIFNKSPLGLPNNLLPNAPAGTPVPSPALAAYLQNMIWNVVTNYPRTGIYQPVNNSEINVHHDFSVYPNPVNDQLHLNLNRIGFSNNEYTITDLLGKQILSGKEHPIPVGSLTPGAYILRLGRSGRMFMKQ